MSRTSHYSLLYDKIVSRKAVICVMGLGYVGLPLAIAFAKKGFRVLGFDTNRSRIQKLSSGKQYIVDINPGQVRRLLRTKSLAVSASESILQDADVIIVCVPTPLRKVKLPDISYVVSASKAIQRQLRPPQLIILESTSYPTTTREVALPILKKSGYLPERDFFLCFSPERINPGDKKFVVENIPKAVGGLSAQSSTLAQRLYATIIANVYTVTNPEVAETSKLLENTFRLVNIALINEFAMLCHKLGISIWEVIASAKTKPFGFTSFYPGPGIGGHCIPCDPVFLSWKAKKIGFKTKLIDVAAYINRFMPRYVVERVENLLRQRSKALAHAKVLIVGVSYKKDVKDLRESPALDIIETLKKRKARVAYFDPFFSYLKINGINLKRSPLSASDLKHCDCVVIVTDHSDVGYGMIQRNAPLVFDTRNVYKKNYTNVVVL